MPAHKIQKQEEISVKNWYEILTLASKLSFENASKVPKDKQLWLQCVLAIVWLTGKRINEILQLKRKHVLITDKEIKIRFFVGKKRSRSAPIEQMPYQKTRTIQHKAVPFIQAYLKEFDSDSSMDEDSQLFAATTRPRVRVVNTKFTNGQGEKETRQYEYTDKGGYIYEENARYWLNKINEQLPPEKRIYFHYGRHSIGIKLAYQGKTPYQIAEILDESVKAAIQYTKHAGGYSQEWTKETD